MATIPKRVPWLPGLPVGKLLLDAMERNSERIGHIEAVTGAEESYGSLRLRSVRLAQALIRFGIRQQDVVTLVTRNTRDSLVLLCGASATGAVVNPLDVLLGTDDMLRILGDTRPRIVFCEEIVLEKMISVLKELRSDAKIVVLGQGQGSGFDSFDNFQKPTGTEDKFEPVDVGDTHDAVAFLLCSSGSTGPPKAVMVTHPYVVWSLYQGMIMDATDRALTFTSVYWVSGLSVALCSCLNGAVRVITTEAFSEELLFKYIKQYQTTRVALSHILFGKMVQHPLMKTADLTKIRDFWVGGGSIPRDIIQKVNDALPNGFVRTVYGQTEAGAVAMAEDKFCKPDSVGRLIAGYAAKIIDLDNDKVLGYHQKGELCLKPPIRVKGYYNNAKATDELFDDEGWLKTGDIGYLDDDGFLFLVDRRKNMMRTKSMFSCSPSDLERILCEHSAVKTAAVVGVKGKDLYDVPIAFVILKPGHQATEKELQKLIADKLPEYKHLTGGVIFTKEISMTPSGKIRIADLKLKAQATYDQKHS